VALRAEAFPPHDAFVQGGRCFIERGVLKRVVAGQCAFKFQQRPYWRFRAAITRVRVVCTMSVRFSKTSWLMLRRQAVRESTPGRRYGAQTTRSTKIPGVMMISGSSAPSSTNALTCTIVTRAAIAMTGPKFRAAL
jgi:hypothetical protein